MIVELQLFKWRIVMTASKIDLVRAVYSKLDGDNHFLMWDFDKATFQDVERSLLEVQKKYRLSKIYIVETRKDEGYHAYCFYKTSLERASEILAATKKVDLRFVAAGIIRGKWTLRTGKKFGRDLKCVSVLDSSYPETVMFKDIRDWCRYKTRDNQAKSRVFKMGVK